MSQTPARLIVKGSGDGERFFAGGDLYRFLCEGGETGGRLGVWDAEVPPGGGPPHHLHRGEAEAFFVYEGEIEFAAGEQRVRLGAGGFVHIPEGVPHAFTNPTDRPARMLVIVAPGGMEQMFRETGRPAPPESVAPEPLGEQEIERLKAAAPRYAIELLGPPLASEKD